MTQQIQSGQALLQKIDETISYINEYKDNKPDGNSTEIINQLIEFQMGTKTQIKKAMKMVNDPNNIEEIAEYLMSHDVHSDDEPNSNNINNNKQPTNNNNDNNDKINTLVAMGYDINSCKMALKISNNNIEMAAQYLIDGVLNQNYQPNIALKGLEFDDVNDVNTIFVGKLIQIGPKKNDKNKKTNDVYWTECGLNDYNINKSFHGSVGIITDIFNKNNTINIEFSNKKQIIIPIKICLSVNYDYKENEDYLLVSGYIHNILYNNKVIRTNRNLPPLINKYIHNYYHTSDLKLICKDEPKKELLITREACKLSNYFNDIFILRNGKIDKLYLNNLPHNTMKLVTKYLLYHAGIKPSDIPCPLRSNKMEENVKDKWDVNFINSMTKKIIFEVILAANALSCKSLLHLGSAKIACLIKKMDQQEINRVIEEEEHYRRTQAAKNNSL